MPNAALRATTFALAVSLSDAAPAQEAPAPVDEAPPATCPALERNPEQASLFDPACNAFMTARPAPEARLAPAPLVAMPAATPAPAREIAAVPLATARALARSPAPTPRDVQFSEGSLTMPFLRYRDPPSGLRVDTNAQLMRPAPDRVGLALGAAAEYDVVPGMRVHAQTQARPASDRFALAFGAAAEYSALPDLKLRAATDVDDARARYRVGARYEIVPNLLGIELGGRRGGVPDAEAWGWDAALTLRAPLQR